MGLAALLTAQLYSPTKVIMVDLDDNRPRVALTLGATHIINSAEGTAARQIMDLTGGAGVDVAIEAVGVVETFDICQSIIAAGGRIANVGVHGKPALLYLEKLWSHNITITTRLVDTFATPMLLKITESGRLDVKKLISHRFQLQGIMTAYQIFANANAEKALKVILSQTCNVTETT